MYAEHTTVVGGCGIGILYHYQREKTRWSDQVNLKDVEFDGSFAGGCGWQIATFIDTKECKETYKIIKARFPIVYQSPIRHNVNSDNNFFFVVFDTGQPPTVNDFGEETKAEGFENGLEGW